MRILNNKIFSYYYFANFDYRIYTNKFFIILIINFSFISLTIYINISSSKNIYLKDLLIYFFDFVDNKINYEKQFIYIKY